MDVEGGLHAVSSSLGRFHVIMCALLLTSYVYQGLFNVSYIFTTMRSEHRCLIPECETADSLQDMNPPWLALAVPPLATASSGVVADPCRRYAPLPGAECGAHAVTNETVACDQWVYPNKDLSIMTEWDMTCSLASNLQLALVGTANNLGRALGLPLFGYVSDAVGRRTALLGGLSVSCGMGIARSLAPNYATFVSFEFLDPIFYDGIGGAAFIMGMELMPTPMRGAWSSFGHAVFAMALASAGLVAWLVPYWRTMLRAVYGSAIISIVSLWFVPESARWLVSKGRTEDAVRVINKVAKMNHRPENMVTVFQKERRRSGLEDAKDPTQVVPAHTFAADLKEFVHSRVLVWRLVACCLSWISILFVYDGLAVYSVSLAGNRYLNFVLVELVEVPSSLIAWKMMALLGRKATLVGSLIPATAFCVAYHFLPAADPGEISWLRTSAVVMAKLCVTLAFTATVVLSAELFPTRVRHTMYALSATCGRFGSALSPQMPLLASVMESLPLLVFGAVCFCCGLLAITFPETAHEALPDSIKEAEAIGRRKPTPATPPATPAESVEHI